MTDKLQEDTVSADRKERIIFDPSAWDKKDKSGRKTSAITSRQNFDNEKFTRTSNKNGSAKKDDDEEKEQVDESAYQIGGSSSIDVGTTEPATKKQKDQPKSNSPQIQFVTGIKSQVGVSKAFGNAGSPSAMSKIGEELIKKALETVKVDKNTGIEPADKKQSASKFLTKIKPPRMVDALGKPVKEGTEVDTKKTLNYYQFLTRMKRAGLGKEIDKVMEEETYAGLEKEDKPGKKKTEMKGNRNAVDGETVEGWKDEQKPVKEGWDDMLKAAAERKKPQPNGGSGKKQGSAYGGSKQKDEPEKDLKETVKSVTFADFVQQLKNSKGE